QVNCGSSRGGVAGSVADRNNDEPGVYSMRFTADLSAAKVARIAPAPRDSSALPRIAGPATVVPLDQDNDGKYDHLKVDYDVDSVGGTCIWFLYLRTGSSGSGPGHRVKTKPGLNHISMELDVVTNDSLHDHSLFSLYVERIKCGTDPEFTTKDFLRGSTEPINVFEQEFAIDSSRFAKQGEFKPVTRDVQKPHPIFVRDYWPVKSNLAPQ